MLNAEALILTVQKHPCLWDTSAEEYHKREYKESAWCKVCSEFFVNWDKLTPAEKYEKRYDVKKRWNNIRDYYKKEIHARRKSNKRRKTYVFSHLLEFLRPVLQKGGSTSKCNDDVETDQQEESPNPIKMPQPIKVKQEIPNEINAFERTIFQSVFDREEDSDLLFLKSLLPDMKKLSDDQKFDFKLGIMQLYRTITNPSSPCKSDGTRDFTCYISDPLKGRDNE